MLEKVVKKREAGDAKIRFGKSFVPAARHVDGNASAYYVNKTRQMRRMAIERIRKRSSHANGGLNVIEFGESLLMTCCWPRRIQAWSWFANATEQQT